MVCNFPIKSFKVSSLLGHKNYMLKIDNDATIIVGPNGSGKSNFLNILYLVLSRQWAKLTDYNFDTIEIETNETTIIFQKDDILEATSFITESSRFSDLHQYLVNNNKLGEFISSESIPFDIRKYYSQYFKIPTSSISLFHNKLREGVAGKSIFFALDHLIKELNLGPIIYMPTYRRIEKDLRNFIPENNPSTQNINNTFSLTKKTFIEIIGAGMKDVQTLIEGKIHSVALSKQQTTEKTAQEYILDIIRGNIKNFSLSRLKNIDEKSLLSFVDVLDKSIFNKTDKEDLSKRILSLRNNKRKKAPTAEERYFGLYIEKLLHAQEKVQDLEKPLIMLNKLASKYIESNKYFDFLKSSKFSTDSYEEDSIELEGLSSGEKQILAMFSYLLLLDDNNFILIIDEPELSLSVPWQKTLIPDIMKTGRCNYIFAVTHSPFIFSNEYKKCLVDTQSMSYKI